MQLIFVLILAVVVVVAVAAALAAIGSSSAANDSVTGGREKNLAQHPRTKSEANVIRILEEITGAKFPTVNPDWLVWRGSTLELDGYNEKLRLALEFSGPLHTKWTPSYESYDRYISRVIKDMVKVRMCAKRGVDLIVVDQNLPRHHIRAYLESRLYDFGRIPRPPGYIPAQVVEPFRNPQMEEELGLAGEFDAVRKIK